MPDKVILTITAGELKGEQFTFDSRDTCIIGRSENCNIVLYNEQNASTISRYHCLLDINPPEISIKDLGSLHGTYVNGKCIGKREQNQTPEEGKKLNLPEYDLKDGDKIRLSKTVLQVSIEEAIPPTWQIPEVESLPNPATIPVNSNLGFLQDYTKLKLLGKGGCGEVYLARNETTAELVALKLMRPEVAVMPNMKEMFLREARNAKMLNHQNLVQLKNYYFADGVFFFTMEYCANGSIIDLMNARGGKLSVEEATRIILQVLDGLHYAHTEKNLVHRDIKPQNIFLTTCSQGFPVAKLGDYGLAKAFDMAGLSGHTMTGTKMGTPVFMSRQQALEFKYAQPDVDVWATAATLYFMLTGRYPRDFPEDVHPMFAILVSPTIPIRQRNSAIPQALAEVIDLALNDKSDLHFQNALAFKNALLSSM